MNIPSFGEIDKITKSRYALVMLVSGRAREIIDGDEPLVDTSIYKPVSLAIEETMKGAVEFASPDESQGIEENRARLRRFAQMEKELKNLAQGLARSEE